LIYITGDTHGNFWRIKYFCKNHKTLQKEDTIIILGDAGINYYLNKKDYKLKEELRKTPITLFCIKGNHEEDPKNINTYKLREWNGGLVYYEEKYPNILFAKDGEIYNINGLKTLVIGGAYSVDKYYRLEKGYQWFKDEQPSEEVKRYAEQNLSKNNWNIDIMLSHTCPLNAKPRHLFLSDISDDSIDNNTEQWLQYIADKTNFKKWYYGHYHGEWKFDKFRLMFNDIEEFKIN
jgi:3-oxoacid CoA-transferase subunit A